jgi:His/Glu/Gln/Arg/opine family amino acid ABC transporter permease subunit
LKYVPTILEGLWTTCLISFLALLIASLPGTLIFLGKKSKIKFVYWLSTVYVEIFEGIPLLTQLFLVFYALPFISPHLAFSQFKTALLVLSLNAIANIASLSVDKAEKIKNDLNTNAFIKIVILSLVKEFRKLIKYSSLLSIIAVTDLLRTGNIIMNATGNVSVLFIVIIIYLIISLILKISYKKLDKILFKDLNIPIERYI